MAEQGFILDIDTRFLQRLEKADQALTKLITATDRVSSSSDKLSSGSLSKFAGYIDAIVASIEKASRMNIGDFGLDGVTEKATKAADTVNNLVKTFSGVNLSDHLSRSYDKISSLKEEIDQFKEWERGNLINTEDYAYIGGVADELNRMIAAHEALEETNKRLSNDRTFENYIDDLNGTSLSARKASHELKQMSEFYKQQDKDAIALAKQEKAEAKEAEREARKQEREARAAAKEAERQQKQSERDNAKATYESRTTYDGAMGYSQATSSINQQIQAINYLKVARNNLNKTALGEKEYKRQVAEINKEIDRQKQSVDELQGKHENLINTADQLKRAFTLAFSVSAIRGYVNKIISVRGEFELQQRSLQALLKNKSEANKLWDQTVQLAVRSPYQIKELVKYTKQLAAYRVETEKLHDTTKMLADISAGLGVDMSRLILAYGQVKAANYLRGTELRQFSEAGINILGELSKYFSELEGRAVSVGEVFERVSNRMVSFSDVESVLKRVTSAGGTFYNMQEIQAETLKGQVSNLKDSIDIMLNEIGKSNEGVLKTSIGIIRTLVDNWEALADSMQSAVVTLGAVKVTTLIANTSFKRLAVTLRQSLRAINPWAVAIAGVVQVGSMLLGHFSELNRITKQYDSLSDSIYGVSVQFQKAFKSDNANSIADMRSQLLQLKELAENEYNIELGFDADSIKDASKDDLESMFSSSRDLLTTANSAASTFARAVENSNFANLMSKFSIVGGAFTGESLNKDLEQYSKIASKVFDRLRLETNGVADALHSLTNLTNEEKDALEKLTAPIGDRTRTEYIEDMQDAYNVLADRIDEVGVNADKTFRQLNRFTRRSKEVGDEIYDLFDSLDVLTNSLEDEQKEVFLKFAIDQMEWDSFQKELAYKIANERYVINITPNVESETPQELEPWAKRVKDAVTKINDEIKKKNPNVDERSLFPIPSVGQTKEAYMALAKEVISIADATYTQGQKIEEQGTVERTKLLKDYSEAFKDVLNIQQSTRDTSGNEEKTLANRIRLVKELYEEYNKLRKVMGHTEAEGEVSSAYRDSFALAFGGTGISLDQFDFTKIEGVIAMLNKLKPLAEKEGQEAKIALQREIGEIEVTIKVEDKERADADFAQSIENMFSGYELSLELDKLNIPKSFAQSLFGLQPVDLYDIRARLEQELALNNEISKERKEQVEKDLQKVKEMEAKAQQKRLEKYLVYARNAVGERAKIKLEEMKKLQEIELAFAPKAGESAIDRDIRETAKQSAIEGVQSDAYQAERKLEWEEFQKSDTFISIFQDLDMASETLINHALTKLRGFRDSWTDMPHEEMKSIVENIEKLELKLVDMPNPFKAYKELRNELKGVGSIEELQADNILQEERILALDKELAVSEQVLSLREEGKDIEADMLAFENDRMDLFGLTAKETKDIVDSQKGIKKQMEGQVSANNKNIDKWRQFYESIRKSADEIQAIQKMANDLYDAFKELNEVVGDDDGPAAVFAEMGMSMANSVMNCLALQAQLKVAGEGAKGFGKAMNSAMGIIGWIVMAVQLITSVLKAAFAAHDNALEKQIKRIQERVEVLQKQWEKLEEAMDEVFSVQQIDAYSDAAKRNMEDQISSYEQMIALEEDKKKTDHEKIKEWREDLEDLKEEYAELLEEGFSTATSGILDDTLGAARDFVDAWYDAFQETGNGLEGLKNNFQEMLKELISQQAALQIVGPYVDMYKDWLKQYVDVANNDSTLTIDEAREWAQKVQSTFPEISALLENFFMGAEDLLQEQGGLSELSKGIQGVTESTAQIIEALLNSMRFYVADSNYRLQNIEAAFASSDVSRNPILNELQQHTQLIRSIESMFDSVIGRGSSVHSGAYLKVLM